MKKASKHRIAKEAALKMIDDFKNERGGGRYRDLPEGFRLDAGEVKALAATPGAAHFVVSFGLKDIGPGKKEITPVFYVTDEKYNIIEHLPLASPQDATLRTADGDANATMMSLAPEEEDFEPGGFLDETQKIPPP